MQIGEMAEALGWKLLTENTDTTREVKGCYCGDLLSWVMGRAREGNVWITIMSNRNVPAVAALCDAACVVLAEGVQPDEGMAALAAEKGVNVLLSAHSAYETALRLHAALS